MTINGKITVGGASALLSQELERPISPRTRESLTHLTNLNQPPELLQQNDIGSVLEIALNVVHLSEDILMSRRQKYLTLLSSSAE